MPKGNCVTDFLRDTGDKRYALPALAALAALAACATTINVPPYASIENRSGQLISEIRYRHCGDTAADWNLMPGGPLRIDNGNAIAIGLPEDCVDLNAYFADGKVAGSQRDIKRQFPLKWAIK